MAPGPRDEDAPIRETVAPGTIAPRLVRFAGPALPYDRTYHLLGRIDKVRKQIRLEQADVVEAHSPYLASAAIVGSGRSAAPIRTAFWHSDHVGSYVQPILDRWLGAPLAEPEPRRYGKPCGRSSCPSTPCSRRDGRKSFACAKPE
jgi:hypothetical protein